MTWCVFMPRFLSHVERDWTAGWALIQRYSNTWKGRQSRACSQMKPLRKRHKSFTTGVSRWHKTFPGCSHGPSLALGLSYAGVTQEWHSLTSVFWQRCLQEQGHLFPWLLNNCLQDLVTWAVAGDKMELSHCLTASIVLYLLWGSLCGTVWKLCNSWICFKNASSLLCNKVHTVQNEMSAPNLLQTIHFLLKLWSSSVNCKGIW